MDWRIVVGLVVSYLIGSFSSALWLGKWMKGKDIRKYGSGNAGFANAIRVFGPIVGIPVLIIDAGKGYLAVLLVLLLPETVIVPENEIFWEIFFGLSAMIGHIFPAYSHFRGGKAVATGLGVVLAIYPIGALLSLFVFLIVLLMTRYVSLSSISGGLSFSVWVIWLYPERSLTLTVFSLSVAGLLLITHNQNIGRLLRGKERKAFLNRKKHLSELQENQSE